jgi:hypothetical protein
MARIIIHTNKTNEEVNEARLLADFNRSYEERMHKAFQLMKLALLFSEKNKKPFKKGIIIKEH